MKKYVTPELNVVELATPVILVGSDVDFDMGE